MKDRDDLEKRIFERVSSQILIKYKVCNGPFILPQTHKKRPPTDEDAELPPVVSKDISGEGILFTTNEYLPISTVLRMEMEIPGIPIPVKAFGEVVRIREIREGRLYDIGIRFISLDKKDDDKLLRHMFHLGSK